MESQKRRESSIKIDTSISVTKRCREKIRKAARRAGLPMKLYLEVVYTDPPKGGLKAKTEETDVEN